MPFDHFNIIAGLYDRTGDFIISEPLLGLLALSPSSRLLDAGGGTGRVAMALHNRVSDVFVVDISRGMLRRAAGKGLTAVQAQVEFLPINSGSIDRVIMMDALHHVMDQRLAVNELWRVLAPGGRIVIVEPDIHKKMVKVLALAEKILLMRSHFLPGEEMASLFTGPGAKIRLVFEDNNVFMVVEKRMDME